MSDLLTRIFDADHQNGDARPYVTRHPMPTTAWEVGQRVIVPIWAQGDVLGHAEATIVEVIPSLHRPGIARSEPHIVAEFLPGVAMGAAASYYPYSVMCAVCFGHRDTACEQCGPAIEPPPTRYGITASVTHHSRVPGESYTRTTQLPYFELNANVQGILNEQAARNIALGIIADATGVPRSRLLETDSYVQANVTAVQL